MVFLLAAQVSTSLPTKYRRFGLLFVTASKIALETTSTGEAFFVISPEFACILCIIFEYGEFRSCAFLAINIAFAKLVLMKPGSINTSFIPNVTIVYENYNHNIIATCYTTMEPMPEERTTTTPLVKGEISFDKKNVKSFSGATIYVHLEDVTMQDTRLNRFH
jgi:hypothetical protein